MIILGISGKNCAGKDTAANYLVQKGFLYYSLSDVIREILIAQSIQPTRENLIRYGTYFREKEGPNFLAKKIIQKLDKTKNCVIVSIRNIAELEELKKLPKFYFVVIEADEKIRFERMLKRKREGDPKTFEEFKRLEELEFSNNSAGQQLHLVLKKADFYIQNNGSIKELYQKINELLEKLNKN
jgi:dCMP deaminase